VDSTEITHKILNVFKQGSYLPQAPPFRPSVLRDCPSLGPAVSTSDDGGWRYRTHAKRRAKQEGRAGKSRRKQAAS
jgi:hypothetical protein